MLCSHSIFVTATMLVYDLHKGRDTAVLTGPVCAGVFLGVAGHWTEDMRTEALVPAKLDSPNLKVQA